MLTCRRDKFIVRARTHSLRQFITLNVLRSTDKKGRRKKSPGYRFDFWLFGGIKEKRGREGRRDGPEVEKQTTAVIS